MSKRIAGSQITREELENENGSDNDVGMDRPKFASESVMSGRKIAVPKRKMGKSSGFNLQSSTLNMMKPSTSQSSNEDVSKEKLMALNLQFKEKVIKSLDEDPVVDLSIIFEKYKAYYSSVKSTKTDVERAPVGVFSFTSSSQVSEKKEERKSNPFAFVNPVPTDGSNTASEESAPTKTETTTMVKDESDSEEDDEQKPIAVEGPKFVLTKQPTTTDSPFTFGTKRKESDEDSNSDVEIKGPQFTFTGTISTGQFNLSKDNTTNDLSVTTDNSLKQSGSGLPANGSEVKPLAQPSNSIEKAAKNGTAFTFDTAKSETNKASNWGASDNTKQTSFSFTSSISTDQTPSTAFSSSHLNKEDETNKPMFAFGVNSSQKKDEKSEKPIFTFSSNAQDNKAEDAKKPSFVFGVNSTSKEHELKQNSSNEIASQGSTNSSKMSSTKVTENTDSAKPIFSFGKSNVTNVKEASSVFNFGSMPSSSKAPSFTFGNHKNDSEQAKPAFTFGSSTITQLPGKDNTISEKQNDLASPTPPTSTSSGFKFSLPFASNTAQPSEEKRDTTVDENGTESNSNDQDESSKGMSMSNGEEHETLLFSQRAKLMLFNPETKAYDSRGVGEFKILQQKDDTSKARLLCRSDGMGHILLNTAVVKSFTYGPLDPNNENLVKCPVVNSEGKLDTYIVKVKQKADGRKLTQSIVDAQKAM